MSKYSEKKLREIIAMLLKKGHEGDYWDYKREWPEREEKHNLVKDIISFGNTTHSNDCFIIYGANDDGTPCKMMKQRTNQNELDNLMSSSVVWAGGNQPKVSLETIIIDGNAYDVLVVYNSDRTPFYLQEDFIPEIKNPCAATEKDKRETEAIKRKRTLHKGIIYARTNDSTTPINGNANPFIIEELWKKRFHLQQPIYIQFIEEMKCQDKWEKGDGDAFSFHHIYRPEFTFQDKPEEQITRFEEYYTWLFSDKNAYRNIFQCKYFGTILREFYFISMDGGRWHCPYPKTSLIPFDFKRYFYFLATSDEMIVYDFTKRENLCSYEPFRILSHYIPMFLDQNEQSAFNCWLKDKQERFETECSKIKPEKKCFKRDSFIEDAIIGKAIVNLFNEFRQESSSGMDL